MPTSIARPPSVVTISACSAGGTVGAPGRVVADQQVGEDRGQLPEHVEQQQVVGQDQTEHRAGERDEVPANAASPASSSAKYQAQ